MTIKTQVNEILDMKMDRQEFIKYVGVGLVAVSGVGTALRMLAPKQTNSNPSPAVSFSYGYGGAPYGGSSQPNQKLPS